MKKKEYIKDKQNNIIYPVTHEDAVIDSNGIKLKDKIDAELDTKQDTLVSGENIKTINNVSILGEGNIYIQGGGGEDPNAVKFVEQTLTSEQQTQARTNIGAGTYTKDVNGIPAADLASAVQTSLGKANSALQPTVSITYSQLVTLRNGGNLIPGAMYRITDYTAATTQSDTRSAGHQFDIIVQAISTNVLSEQAQATLHSGDTYFVNSNLGAWQLWYCLDNDIEKFSWAGSCIYNGSAKYIRDASQDITQDNTQYYAWINKQSDVLSYTLSETPSVNDLTYDDGFVEDWNIDNVELGHGVIYRMIDEWNNDCPYDFKNIQFKRVKVVHSTGYDNLLRLDNKYYGIPSLFAENNLTGLERAEDTTPQFFYTFHVTDTENNLEQDLTTTIYRLPDLHTDDVDTADCCSNNTIIAQYGHLYDEYEHYNDVIQFLPDIVFHNEHYYIDDDNCGFDYCVGNTIDGYKMSFGQYCSHNIVGSDSSCNIFGNDCRANTLGSGCLRNSFSDGCFQNTLGNNSNENTFGTSSDQNTLGAAVVNCDFGSSSMQNNLGAGCSHFRTGSSTIIKNRYKRISVNAGCSYINLDCTATIPSSSYYQNVHIASGVNNATITDSNVGQTYQTTYQPTGSQVVNI